MITGDHRVDLGDIEVVVDDVLNGWHELFLDDDRCFLCGVKLTEATRTAEHVIPKWLQRRYELWNQRLELVNGSSMPYRHATVPACHTCNNGPLHALEDEVSVAFAAGRVGVEELAPMRLWQWLLKLSYGLIRIEHRRPDDPAHPDAGAILDREGASAGALLHLYLQSLIGRTEIESRLPLGTFFVFETQAPDRSGDQFDMVDIISPGPFIAVRAGRVGVVASSTDLGALSVLGVPGFNEAAGLALHPTQFRELCARMMYAVHLLEPGPDLLVAQTGAADRTVLIDHSWEDGPPRQRPWRDDMDIYVRLLARAVEAPLTEIQPSPETCWTCLLDEANSPIHWPLEDDRL
jgi:hypothetical protein